MNIKERQAVVLAMEILARNINDEEVLENWLINGIADGDIDYTETVNSISEILGESVDEYYIEDETFSDLLACFLRCMKKAYHSGGLYCDGIVDSIS